MYLKSGKYHSDDPGKSIGSPETIHRFPSVFIEGQYATIEHRYSYDGLYQLTAAQGTYRNHPYGPKNPGGEWRRDYSQSYRYDAFFNMALKTSRDTRVPLSSDRSPLNYSLEYRYENPEKPH